MENSYLQELRSESLGTMILILFGVGVTLGVYAAARLAGAHLNPAVAIEPAAFRGLREVPHPAGMGGPGEECARIEAATRVERVGSNPVGTQEARS